MRGDGTELYHELHQITHPDLRDLAQEIIGRAPEYFWTVRASRNWHPPDERGKCGLLLHKKRAFKLAKELCRCAGIDGFQRQLILAAVLVHDVCKEGVTDKGVGYSVGGHELLLPERYGDNKSISKNKYWEPLLRLVETHEGRWGEKQPQTREQWIVHLADYISTRVDIRVLLDEEGTDG